MYDQGPKLGMRRKRNCAEDSALVKGKRPDFFLLSSRALLFKGEDKTSEAELEKALEELSTKLKEWGAAVHGKVQLNPPYCQATRHAQCCMNSLCKTYCACKYHGCCEIWFCMLYAACVSRGTHVSVFSSIVGGVPSVLCLRWLAIPDVCHATRDTRGFQVSPSTIPSHIGGQAADCLDCSAELLDYEGTG